MHTMVNIPNHGQSRYEVRPVVKGTGVELRVFDKDKIDWASDPQVTAKPDLGLGTGADIYLAYLADLDDHRRRVVLQCIGDALCFVLRKGQEAGYEQAKAELREWIGP